MDKEALERSMKVINEIGAGPAVNGVFPLLPGFDHDGNPLSDEESAWLQQLHDEALEQEARDKEMQDKKE